MILRRVAAVLSVLASLHLSVGTAGAACADPSMMGTMPGSEQVVAVAAHDGRHAGPTSAAELSPPADGESWRAAGSTPAADDSCGAGSGAPCCAGMVTCSATVALAERGTPAGSAAIVERTYAALVQRPLSFRPALEPPPPKA